MPVSAASEQDLLDRIAARVSAYDGRQAGGALLGPRLLLLAAYGHAPEERLVELGTAVELLRRATLVHHDPQAEKPWAPGGGLLYSQTLRGDTLLAAAFQILATDGDTHPVAILSRSMASVAGGELERVAGSDTGEVRRAAYAEGAAMTGALLASMAGPDERDFVAWASLLGVTHERSLSGIRPDAAALKSAAPAWLRGGEQARLDSVIDAVGHEDVPSVPAPSAA